MLIQKFVYKIIKSNSSKKIALEEIRSIYMSFFKPREKNIEIRILDNNLVVLDAPLYIGFEIARRAALVKWSGIILNQDNIRLIRELHFKRLRGVPSSFKFDAAYDKVNEYITFINESSQNKKLLMVDLRDPYYKFKIIKIQDTNNLAMEIANGRSIITKRNPFFRPFAPPATMDSVTSRLLVNLSRVNIGDIFLDPFAGTGSLLIESYFIGAIPIGIEIHPKYVFGAIFNAQSVGAEINVMIGDATKIPLPDNYVDAIATDPPYGRSASTFKRNIRSLYMNFLREAHRVLKPRRYLAMFYPIHLISISRRAIDIGFIEIFKAKMQVHKDLSRYLTVFLKP